MGSTNPFDDFRPGNAPRRGPARRGKARQPKVGVVLAVTVFAVTALAIPLALLLGPSAEPAQEPERTAQGPSPRTALKPPDQKPADSKPAEKKSGSERPAALEPAVQQPADKKSPDPKPEPPVPSPPPFVGDPLQKPLITAKDLAYVGSFSMPPRGAGGASNAYTYGGLTHRYVRGELRFFSTSHPYDGDCVYEVKFPGLSTTSPPLAEVVADWNNIYGGKRWVDNDGGYSKLDPSVHTYGLHWSEERRRLYWSYGHWYNTTSPSNPCLGFSTLNEETTKATGVAAWRLRGRGEMFARGGSVDIPRWFADRFTGGKTLGIGFGGYFSIIASGSMGPALCAVAHPDPATVPHKGSLEQIPLLGYPYTPKPPGPPDRCHRNADYKTEFDGWKPSGDIGYWTWQDQIWSGGSWVDLPDKQAVLFFCVLGHGRVWYEKSVTRAERGKYWCLAFHPRDLAGVAQGRKKEWEVQPAAAWEVTFGAGFGPNIGGWEGEPFQMVCGATFDAKTRRLYVLVRSVWKTEVEYYPRVYCWQVR
jgi:hypothetical protein